MINKKLTYISVLLFFIGIILIIFSSSISFALSNMDYLNDNALKDSYSENIIASRNEKNINITLSFIGDSLIGSFKGENYIGNFRELLENNNYSFPYKNVYNIFKDDDFTIANGENVFTDNKLYEIEKDHSPAYWYYAPTRFANIYKKSSIEVVSVMNNHTYDYGFQGYKDTISSLKDKGIIVGEEMPVILEKNGFKIGLLCINLFSNYQYNECIRKILNIKDSVDYVIVYFHGGKEYSYTPIPEIEEYSRGFIDNGADLVIGAHPHVLEPIEIYNNKTIVYSLGSFLFGGTKNFVNRTAIYQKKIKFSLDTKEIEEENVIIPCYLYSSGTGYESWIPSIITNENEKQKVLDFMNGLTDSPI